MSKAAHLHFTLMFTAFENILYISPDTLLKVSHYTEWNKEADKCSDLSKDTKQIQDRALNWKKLLVSLQK